MTLLSGSLPTSSDTIESTIWVDCLRTLRAPTIDARTPVTTMSVTSSSDCGAAAAAGAASGAVWAWAAPASISANMDVVVKMTGLKAIS